LPGGSCRGWSSLLTTFRAFLLWRTASFRARGREGRTVRRRGAGCREPLDVLRGCSQAGIRCVCARLLLAGCRGFTSLVGRGRATEISFLPGRITRLLGWTFPLRVRPLLPRRGQCRCQGCDICHRSGGIQKDTGKMSWLQWGGKAAFFHVHREKCSSSRQVCYAPDSRRRRLRRERHSPWNKRMPNH